MKDITKAKFTLMPYCYLVKGAKRAAIYDLKNGNVYSINEEAKKLLEELDRGISIEDAFNKISQYFLVSMEEILDFIQKLVKDSVGTIYYGENTYSINHYINQVSKVEPTLSFLWIELTQLCNLRCLHCYAESTANAFNSIKMRESDWIKVIKEAYTLGCRKVQFIGGEPFIVRDLLFTLIQEARNIGYQFIEVYTNATLIKEQDLEFLKNNQVKIAVSVYGPIPIIHDTITQKEGSFIKTIDTIKKLIQKEISLRIGIVEMKQNSMYIKNTITYLSELGVPKKNIKVDIIRPSGRGCDKNLMSSELIYKQSKSETSFLQCSLSKFQKAISGHNCFFDKICVSENGNIFPCIMERRVVLGNILNSSLTEIYNSDKTKQIRFLTKDKIETCQDCEYRYCCFDCRVMAKSLFAKPSNCSYNPYTGEWSDCNK